ncbi:Aromatic-L-amino-acid decarboxylase [Aphelenchoides besseyi]|nr:Aromatic-L-amino-acid decarboxylase [Aphelenchoides besseyi]
MRSNRHSGFFFVVLLTLQWPLVVIASEQCARFAERTDGEVSYDPEDEATLRLGSIATLNCNNGNIRRSRCTSAGWKPQTFTRCEPVSRDESSHSFGGIQSQHSNGCPSITNVTNGFVVYSPMGLAPYQQDTMATLNCHLGYVNSGPQTSRCEHGAWTELGSCETATSQQCMPIGDCGKTGWEPFPGLGRCEEVANGQVTYLQANPAQPYSSGTTAILTCNINFSPQGSSSAYCSGSLWSPSLGTCMPVNNNNGIGGFPGSSPGFGNGIGGIGGATCPAMIAVLNGQLQYSNSQSGTLGPFQSGTSVSLQCNPGFMSSTGMNSATCQNGAWTPAILGPCSPGNGIGGFPGSSPGFGIGGIGSTCPAAAVPLNGQLQYSGANAGLGTYSDGALVFVSCNPGFQISGSSSATCRSGQWYPPLGLCQQQGQNTFPGQFNGLGTSSSSCLLGLPPPLGGTIQYSSGSTLGPFNAGTTATLICNGGLPSGPSSSSCLGSAGWSPPTLGTCGSAFGSTPLLGGNGFTNGLNGIGMQNGAQCLTGVLPPLNGRLTYSTGKSPGSVTLALRDEQQPRGLPKEKYGCRETYWPVNSDQFRVYMNQIVELIIEYVRRPHKYKVFTASSLATSTISRLFRVLALFSNTLNSLFSAGFSYPDILGETLASGLSVIPWAWLGSPSLAELEMVVINWFGRAIGLPADFYFAEDPTMSKAKLVAYTSAEAHSAIEKGALMSMVRIRPVRPSEEHFGLNGSLLDRQIKKDVANGLIPFYIHGSLGTTNTTACDNLEELGQIAQHYKCWFHVDAAYGGSALICPEYRYLAKGIELVDSLNCNMHKMLLCSVSMSFLWCRHKNDVQNAFAVHPTYLIHQAETPSFRHWGIQLSRRALSLKAWFVFRTFGLKGMQEHVRRMARMASIFRELIKHDSRFELVGHPILTLTTFRLRGMETEEANKLTMGLCEYLNRSNRIFNLDTIRVNISFNLTDEQDVDESYRILSELTDEYLSEQQTFSTYRYLAKAHTPIQGSPLVLTDSTVASPATKISPDSEGKKKEARSPDSFDLGKSPRALSSKKG